MTTIVAVKHNDRTAIAGDGQVTMGEKYIMKGTAHKVRRIYDDIPSRASASRICVVRWVWCCRT